MMYGLEQEILLPNKAFFSEAFINSVHANKAILLASTGTKTVTVSKHDAIKFHGDLYGYLTANKVEQHLFPAILVLNDINSQIDFDENIDTLYIPSVMDMQDIVEQINLST